MRNYTRNLHSILNLQHCEEISNIEANEIWKKKGIMAWGLNNLFYKYVGKYKYFDFNGANSPLRGDDKHSYGSYEKLYFQLEY